jgi:hypothetical protein
MVVTENTGSRDSSVGIATGHRLDGPGLIPGSATSSQQRPDRLWGPPSLLSNGYRGLLPRGRSSRGVKLTTHHHLMQRSRMVELNLYFPIRLHGILLHRLSTGKTLLFFYLLLKISPDLTLENSMFCEKSSTLRNNQT